MSAWSDDVAKSAESSRVFGPCWVKKRAKANDKGKTKMRKKRTLVFPRIVFQVSTITFLFKPVSVRVF